MHIKYGLLVWLTIKISFSKSVFQEMFWLLNTVYKDIVKLIIEFIYSQL